MHIAVNMVWMVVNMVALDSIHSPNEREMTSFRYFIRKGKEQEVCVVVIYCKVCKLCTCGAPRRRLLGGHPRPRCRSGCPVSEFFSALRRPPRDAFALVVSCVPEKRQKKRMECVSPNPNVPKPNQHEQSVGSRVNEYDVDDILHPPVTH